jgi:hypothetical protein
MKRSESWELPVDLNLGLKPLAWSHYSLFSLSALGAQATYAMHAKLA